MTNTTRTPNLEQQVTLTLRNVAPYALEQAISRVWEEAGQFGYITITEPSVTVTIRLDYMEGEERESDLETLLTRVGLDSSFDHSRR